MSNTVYFISDLHIGHNNILKYQAKGRPFSGISEMHEYLVDKWNTKIRKRDTVWVLGDVLMNKNDAHILTRLQGIKHLVLGNHDTYGFEFYSQYFNKVAAYHKLSKGGNKILLSHYPVHNNQIRRYDYNIHGHLHANNILHKFYKNVSVETNDFQPQSLEELNIAPKA